MSDPNKKECSYSEKPNNSDTISRQAAIDALAKMMPSLLSPDGSHPADEEIFKAQEIFADCIKAIENLPSAQPEIIYCKDCVKHNIGVDDTPYKSYICPLVKFRGKAQGHEFDYQYCVYGVKKEI